MNLLKLVLVFAFSFSPKLQKMILDKIIKIQGPREIANTEKILIKNQIWPYEIIGTFVIVDAGGYDGEYPTWATGSLEVGKNDEVSIDIFGDVVVKAKIDLDSGDKYSVLLGPPVKDLNNVFSVEEIHELKNKT